MNIFFRGFKRGLFVATILAIIGINVAMIISYIQLHFNDSFKIILGAIGFVLLIAVLNGMLDWAQGKNV